MSTDAGAVDTTFFEGSVLAPRIIENLISKNVLYSSQDGIIFKAINFYTGL